MKILTFLGLTAIVSSLAPSVLAGGPPPVPDAGATAILLGVGALSLGVARRFLGSSK